MRFNRMGWFSNTDDRVLRVLAAPYDDARWRRKGLTLVELVVALTLASLLMVSLVGVLRQLSFQVRAATVKELPIWPPRLDEMLRRDLMAAQTVWREGDVVWMQTDTLAGTMDGESEAGLRAIGYHCTLLSDGRGQLRRSSSSGTSVLAIGPTSMIISRLDANYLEQPLPPRPGPVPRRLRVLVLQNDHVVHESDVIL